jgi:hypothetical protein
VSTRRIDLVGAQPDDPPWWRLLFLLVQGREGEWWRGLLLVALAGLLLVGGLGTLLVLAGWTGGAIGIGSLAALSAARRRRRRSGTCQRAGGAAADATDLEADAAEHVGVEQVAGVDHDAPLDQLRHPAPVQHLELGPFGEQH